MEQIDVSSWEGFESKILQLVNERKSIEIETGIPSSELIYRGIPNHKWRLTTTLERYSPGDSV